MTWDFPASDDNGPNPEDCKHCVTVNDDRDNYCCLKGEFCEVCDRFEEEE